MLYFDSSDYYFFLVRYSIWILQFWLTVLINWTVFNRFGLYYLAACSGVIYLRRLWIYKWKEMFFVNSKYLTMLLHLVILLLLACILVFQKIFFINGSGVCDWSIANHACSKNRKLSTLAPIEEKILYLCRNYHSEQVKISWDLVRYQDFCWWSQ